VIAIHLLVALVFARKSAHYSHSSKGAFSRAVDLRLSDSKSDLPFGPKPPEV